VRVAILGFFPSIDAGRGDGRVHPPRILHDLRWHRGVDSKGRFPMNDSACLIAAAAAASGHSTLLVPTLRVGNILFDAASHLFRGSRASESSFSRRAWERGSSLCRKRPRSLMNERLTGTCESTDCCKQSRKGLQRGPWPCGRADTERSRPGFTHENRHSGECGSR
jgi:hypothetical protein